VLDVGAGEFIALGVLAMIVLGPEKLPRYAAEAARFLRKVRGMANEARSEVRRELGPDFDGVSLRSLNPRSVVRQHLLDPLDEDLPPRSTSRPPRRTGPGTPTPPRSSSRAPRFDSDAT
jgi:sec-independent protein translocase protein TatB